MTTQNSFPGYKKFYLEYGWTIDPEVMLDRKKEKQFAQYLGMRHCIKEVLSSLSKSDELEISQNIFLIDPKNRQVFLIETHKFIYSWLISRKKRTNVHCSEKELFVRALNSFKTLIENSEQDVLNMYYKKRSASFSC